MNTQSGASIFLSLLKDEGITHIFGNPGTTELPIMNALKDHGDLNYILGLQESLVVAMADGFSRASGQLSACNVHVAPGLGNAIGSIYNARFTGTPIIITAGQQEQGHGLTEPLLYDPLLPIAQPVVKWGTEITRIQDLPRIIRRAAKVAMAPPTGPVFLSLPGDVLNEITGLDIGNSTRVESRVVPSNSVLEGLVDRILLAKNPVIICGDEIVRSDALEQAANFAEKLGAEVFQQTVPYGSHYLSEHVCYMGTLSRDQEDVQATLRPYDLIIVLGADVLRMSVWSEIDPLPKNMPIIQIGLNDWEMGKNYPAERAIYGHLFDTLKALSLLLEEKGGIPLVARTKSALLRMKPLNWSAKRKKLALEIESVKTQKIISPDLFTLRLVNALPENAVVVHEGLTSTRYLPNLLAYKDRFSFHGFASGGIGWALPAAVGVQLAQINRPVCAIVGDGSSMYSIQSLWTAAHLKLPITYVIANNRSYKIIKQRLKAFHNNSHFVGMDFKNPPISFVGMAQAMGMDAQYVSDINDFSDALSRAMINGKPNLIEVEIDSSVMV